MQLNANFLNTAPSHMLAGGDHGVHRAGGGFRFSLRVDSDDPSSS